MRHEIRMILGMTMVMFVLTVMYYIILVLGTSQEPLSIEMIFGKIYEAIFGRNL